MITALTAEPADLGPLYLRWRLPLTRLAHLLVADVETAEDVVHDVFARLQARPAVALDGDSEAAYLRTAVVNGCRSVHRRRRTARLALLPSPVDAAPADEAVIVAEEHRRLLALVDDLPPRQREVVVLRYWSGLSEREIAETMGVSPGTVKSAASRALARLARGLEDA